MWNKHIAFPHKNYYDCELIIKKMLSGLKLLFCLPKMAKDFLTNRIATLVPHGIFVLAAIKILHDDGLSCV